jgi:acetolactate synthase I/II/III large subunit
LRLSPRNEFQQIPWITFGRADPAIVLAHAEVAQPDFEKLAVGFGAKGFRVNRPDDFREIDKALAVEDGPAIVNVCINGDVELPVSWEIAQHLENTGE